MTGPGWPAAPPVWARATITLPDLAAGRWALVDPADEYIAHLLDRGFLVPSPGAADASAGRVQE